MKGMDFMKPSSPRPWISSTVPSPSCRARASIATIIIGILLILFCVTALGKVLQRVMVGRARSCCTRRWAAVR